MSAIYLFGDSIGQGVVWNEQRSRYCLSPLRCTKQLQQYGLPIESHAVMGRTILQGYADFTDMQTEPGGICVIEYGGNDCNLDWDAVAADPDGFHNGQVPLPEFRAALVRFIRQARSRGLQPVLITPPPLLSARFCEWISQRRDRDAILRYLGDVEHIYRWQERYARCVQAVAWEEHCRLIDLRSAFLQADDFPALMCADGMHPSDAGQTLMTKAILSFAEECAASIGA